MINRDEPTNQSQTEQIQEATLAIYSLVIKHLLTTSNTKTIHLELASLVFALLCRPKAMGNSIPKNLHELIYEQLALNALALCYVKDELTIKKFSIKAAQIIVNNIPLSKAQTEQINTDPKKENLANLEAILKAELAVGADQKTAINRTALRLHRDKEYQRKNFFVPNLNINCPLAHVLNVDSKDKAILSHDDIRTHMLKSSIRTRYKEKSQLLSILTQAAPFAEKLLVETLGPNTYKRFKPVGYADREGTTLLIEISSSADAYEFNFHKNEILKKLKNHPGFEKIIDLKLSSKIAFQGSKH